MASRYMYALIMYDWDGFTDIVLTKRITGVANPSVASRGMYSFEGKVHTVEILEFGDSELILEEADTQWAGTHRALAVEREREKRGTGRRRYGGFLDVWPSDAFEADTIEDSSKSSKKVKQVKRLKTRKSAPSTQNTQQSGREIQQAMPNPPSDQTSVQKQFPSVEQGSNGRSINVLYEGSAEVSGEKGQPQRLPCYTEGLQPDQVDIVEHVVRNQPNHISVGSQTEKVVIIDATETIHHVLDDRDSHSFTVKKTLTKMKQSHDEMVAKLSSLNSKMDQILAVLKTNPTPVGPINLPDCQVVEIQDGSLANYVRNLCSEAESANKENTNPASAQNDVPDHVPETPDLHSEAETLYSVTPQISIDTAQDTGTDIIPESDKRPSPVRRLSFSDSRKTPLRTVSFNSTSVTPVNKDFLVLECGSGKTIQEINCPEDAMPGNFEFRIAQETIVTAKSGAVSQKNFMWRLAQAIFKKDELVGRNCQGRKGKGKLSPRRWHATVHAYVDTYGRSKSDFVKACEGINSGIRHLK